MTWVRLVHQLAEGAGQPHGAGCRRVTRRCASQQGAPAVGYASCPAHQRDDDGNEGGNQGKEEQGEEDTVVHRLLRPERLVLLVARAGEIVHTAAVQTARRAQATGRKPCPRSMSMRSRDARSTRNAPW